MKKIKKLTLISLILSLFIGTLNIPTLRAENAVFNEFNYRKLDYFKGRLREKPDVGDIKDTTINIENIWYDVYKLDDLNNVYFVKSSSNQLHSLFRSTCFPGDWGYPYCKGDFPKIKSDPEANEQFVKCILNRTFGFTPDNLSIAIIISLIKKKGKDEAIKYIVSTTIGGPTFFAVKLVWDSSMCIIFKN